MKYCTIVFFQGDNEDTEKLNKLLNDYDYDLMIDYMKQWDYGEYNDIQNKPSHGSNDRTYEKDNYILSYNSVMGYYGLDIILNSEN